MITISFGICRYADMLVMMINDSALCVYRDGDIAYEEPGMAIVTNDEICFGKSALKKAR